MSAIVTSNGTEGAKTTRGWDYWPDAWNVSHDLVTIDLTSDDHVDPAAGDERIMSDESACLNTDKCTYETDEIEEPEEAQEAKETQEEEEAEENKKLEEREQIDSLDPKLSVAIDKAISECRVSINKNVNRPLFMLAHKLRSIEEELKTQFSVDVVAEIVHRWQEQNSDHLENEHDYLTECLDKLSLVRFPQGRALARAVEIARGIVPPKQTMLLSPDVQLLASLCSVLQYQAGKKPFFLDGRSAAKALGKPHETVASWLRALCQLRVIKRISKGSRGTASRYLYLG